MKNLKSNSLFVIPKYRMAYLALFLLLAAFTSYRGGYSYTLYLNNKLVSEHYLTSKFETPTLTLHDQDMKGTFSVYFNECGQIGQVRKLSLRTSDQKVLKEWSFANSTIQHDPLEVALKDISTLLNSGKIGIYYASERVTKPQVLVYLVGGTATSKKAASR